MSSRHRPGGNTPRKLIPLALPSPSGTPRRSHARCAHALVIALVPALPALADVRDAIGYTRLQSDLMGSNLTTGAGVPVGQVEAFDGSGYFPSTETDPTTGFFVGKHFTLITPVSEPNVTLSGHGEFVGGAYYGAAGSPAPDVHNIYAYSVA